MLQPAVPYVGQGAVGSLDMPQLAEQPMAQPLQTKTSLSYIFMLAVDNRGKKYDLVKGFWHHQP